MAKHFTNTACNRAEETEESWIRNFIGGLNTSILDGIGKPKESDTVRRETGKSLSLIGPASFQLVGSFFNVKIFIFVLIFYYD